MTDRYYFRVRRYLRTRGEQELDKFEVHLENNVYVITKWDYSNHPRPTLEVLRAIRIAEVDDEIEKTVKPSHSSDIYAFESQRNNSMQIAANRENFCSTVSENQIQLDNAGFYRITVSGKQVIAGLVGTEFNIFLTIGEEPSTVIYTKAFMGRSSFHFVGLLPINGPSKLHLRVKVTQDSATFQLSGNILVEFL